MPRPQRPKAHVPSPLQQVISTDDKPSRNSHLVSLTSFSTDQIDMRTPDPAFWKRFSVAVHRAETFETEMSSTSVSIKTEENQWLTQQRREDRRCRVLCVVITMIVGVAVTGGAVCGWWFSHRR